MGGLENIWLIDSGCSRHMTGDRGWFSSLTPVKTREYVTFGDKGRGRVMAVGEVISCTMFKSENGMSMLGKTTKIYALTCRVCLT